MEPATEPSGLTADQEPTTPAPDEPLLDQTSQATGANPPAPAEEGRTAIELPAEAATIPAISDPVAELVSYPLPSDPGAAPADSRFA